MMTKTNMLHARAGAAAIAAALALSPTYAAAPKPIVYLSASPAVSGKAASAKPAAPPRHMIGPVDEQTAEIGGGAILLLALGAAAAAMIGRRRRRADEEAWNYDQVEPSADAHHSHEPVHEDPLELDQPTIVAPSSSAFAWGNAPRHEAEASASDDGSDRRPGETWVERAYRGPSPANPSVSLKHRLSRAAFFDKREREVAAGKAAPIDPDAGLPDAMVDEQEREVA